MKKILLVSFFLFSAFVSSAYALSQQAAYASCLTYNTSHSSPGHTLTCTAAQCGSSSGNYIYDCTETSVSVASWLYNSGICQGTFTAGTCVCPSGKYLASDGYSCLTDPVCTAPQYLSNHQCVSDPVCTAPQYLSNHQCVNEPTCVGQQSKVGHSCQDPVCRPPESLTIYHECRVPECTNGKVLNPSTGLCQVPPTCGTTETYNASLNTCELRHLPCPTHSHANSTNDQCLPDPPLGCPSGQHDDGTYTCVADAATGCRSDQVKGYIFGVPQCIKKSNTDEAAAQEQTAKQQQAAADAKVAASQAAADASQAALDADPTNAALKATNDANQATLARDKAAAGKAADDTTKAKSDADSAALKAIADATQSMDDRQAHMFDDVPGGDNIQTFDQNVTVSDVSASGTCPQPITVTTAYGVLSFSFDMYCDFASMISPVVISVAWLSAGILVLGAIRE